MRVTIASEFKLAGIVIAHSAVHGLKKSMYTAPVDYTA